MKSIATLLLSLLSIATFSQSLSKLEYEVQSAGINNLSDVRKIAQEIFEVDPFNEIATYTLIASLRYRNKEKNVIEHFAELKANFPNNPNPYILSSYILYPELSLTDTSGLRELKLALELDPFNVKANQLIGRLYYILFHEAINQDHILTGNFANASRKYIIRTIELEPRLWGYGIVINQLNYFLKDRELDSTLLNYKKITHPRLNILEPIEYYQYALNGTSEFLDQINEPVIENLKEGMSFRLEWIRTFNNQIVIRLNSTNEMITVTWKRTDGYGGFYIGELVENETRTLSKEDFNEFLSLIEKINFWEVPTSLDRGPINDGSYMTLEGIADGKHHVIYRRSGDPELDIIPQIISLTELKFTSQN